MTRFSIEDYELPDSLLMAIREYRETGVLHWPAPTDEEPEPERCTSCHGTGLRSRPNGRLTTYVECGDCSEERRLDRASVLYKKIPAEYRRTFNDYFTFVNGSPVYHKDGLIAEEWAWHGTGSIIFTGNVGLLKTTLATAAFLYRITHFDNPPVRTAEWIEAPELLAQIRRSYSGHETDIVERVKHCDLLLLDDIGRVSVNDRNAPWVQQELLAVIGWRHNNALPTIFTSNLSILQLESQIGDALVSRIVGMCDGGKNIIVMDAGTDMRYGR